MTEFEIIQNFFTDWCVPHDGVLVGVGDDALVWHNPQALVVSVDTAVVNRHFPEHASPEQIAARAFLPALSDLAAMAATPAFFTLALTLPNSIEADWLKPFAAQLRRFAEQYAIVLAGGDTTSGDQLTISISVHGTCAHPVLRSGARAGDDIWVTGTLGAAAAALPYVLKKQDDEMPLSWQQAYWQPQPKIKLAQALLGCIHSATDISDGLIGDAMHIAKRSQVELEIDVDTLPIDAQVNELDDGLRLAIAGGDDYQLLFTADPIARDEIIAIAQSLNEPVTRVGEVKLGEAKLTWIKNKKPITLPWQSFQHF